MHNLKILLISSALPRDTTAGEIVLYRHFSQVPEWEITIATENLEGLTAERILEIETNKIINRLSITRLSIWTNDICQCLHPFLNYKNVRNYIKNDKPNLIVTVAEGIHWIAALQMSQEFNIPLVTIFHDWWPDLICVHSWAKTILEKRFKQLYQKSSLAFCVSERMQQLLGNHPNAEILYPIPDCLTAVEEVTISHQQPFKLVYTGSLSGIYAKMLQELWTALQGVHELQLKLFGRPPNWSNELLQKLNKQNIYGGFLPINLLKQELAMASALIVTISFEEKNRRWAETSFPSKLVAYCQYNKPIIIWGPEYCSAVRWARQHNSALVVTSKSVDNLVKSIKELALQPEEQTRLKKKTLAMAQEMFDPEKIQQKFVDSLYKVATYF
jgi:glycosyltransferase involved in cell wall biosynthesis